MDRKITSLLLMMILLLFSGAIQAQKRSSRQKPEVKITNQREVSGAQKREFLALLDKLPRKGDFFTERAVRRAVPYLPVLFALDEKDLTGYSIYGFLAISSGLFERKQSQDYAARHFEEIRHPKLKLFWAARFLDTGRSASKVINFLKASMSLPASNQTLAEMFGPRFEDFKRRLSAYSVDRKQTAKTYK